MNGLTDRFAIPGGGVFLIVSALWFYAGNGDIRAQKTNDQVEDGIELEKPLPAAALSTNAVPLKEGLNRKIGINLKDADITFVLKYLAQKGNIKLITHEAMAN